MAAAAVAASGGTPLRFSPADRAFGPQAAASAAGGAQAGYVEARLDSAHDLASLLAALHLRDQKDQRVHCEASARGLKFVAQTAAKDVAVFGWMQHNSFKDYKFAGEVEEMNIRLPVSPLLSCLHIFSERAALTMKYPFGDTDDLYLSMEEDGAVTECRVRTLVMEEAPAAFGSFFAPGEPASVLRPAQPEAWYAALSEFQDMDAPDVALHVTLRVPSPTAAADAAVVILRAQTLMADAEVELSRSAFEDLDLAPEVVAAGEVTHSYPLQSVLGGCLRAAKDAKGVKMRLNREGVMSTQFILRGRGQLFCEALVSPLADLGAGAGVAPPAAPPAVPAGVPPGVGGAAPFLASPYAAGGFAGASMLSSAGF